MRLKSLVLGGILALAGMPALAADPADAQALVRDSTREMLQVLREDARDGHVDLDYVRDRLEEVVLPHLDFVTMTKLAVGRDWLKADTEQKRALVTQFRRLLVNTYVRSLKEYDDQALEFLPLEAEADATRVKVRSRVSQGGEGAKVPVEYRLRFHNAAWKVYDIAVDGISLVTTYRSSFSEIVAREGLAGLIAHLQKKNAENSQAASS